MLDEPGTDQARDLFVSASSVLSSRLLVPEAHSAISRTTRARRYSPGGTKRARELLRTLLGEVDPLELTESIADRAGDLAGTLRLRGADAVHLASYERVAVESSVLVATDGELARAALSLGHAVAIPRG